MCFNKLLVWLVDVIISTDFAINIPGSWNLPLQWILWNSYKLVCWDRIEFLPGDVLKLSNLGNEHRNKYQPPWKLSAFLTVWKTQWRRQMVERHSKFLSNSLMPCMDALIHEHVRMSKRPFWMQSVMSMIDSWCCSHFVLCTVVGCRRLGEAFFILWQSLHYSLVKVQKSNVKLCVEYEITNSLPKRVLIEEWHFFGL